MADRAYKGVVRETFEKDWKDRDTGENIVLLSFQIEGEKKYFRTGTVVIKDIVEGAYISFTATDPGNNVDFKSVKVVEGEAPAVAPKAAPTPASGGGGSAGSRDSYWANKEKYDVEVLRPTIAYSASQKNATAIVVAAMNADLLSFGNANKGKKLDMLIDYVEETTVRLAVLQMAAPGIMTEANKEANDES